MRRADRLFDIIQLMRRNRLVRAQDLARELEVSERTIYRDIAARIASGVPIEGEAGVGYILRGELDLPPLMFGEEEIEALVLGARIVEGWADPALARAASKVLAKIEAVLPERLRDYMDAVALVAPRDHWSAPVEIDIAELRRAIRERRKLAFIYRSKGGDVTERIVHPLLLSFFGTVWTLTSWCEMREDFRTFRLDGVHDPRFLNEHFRSEPGHTLADLMARPAQAR
ncbi:MAG: helix-turn-helix transcriptional regulator [Paracoccus sp. (in: a-proteobacteria)]